MTPAAATAPAVAAGTPAPTSMDGAGLDLPGAALSDALAGGDAAPFSAALAILQDPLLTGSSTDKPATKQDEATQIQMPATPPDPAAAALAAVLQWLRQSTTNLPQPAHEAAATRPAADTGTSIGALAGDTSATAAALPAMLVAQFKAQVKSGDGTAPAASAGQGSNTGAAEANANAIASGTVGKPQVALPTGINNPLPQELQALAAALGQPLAEQGSPRSPGERAGDANGSAPTAIDSLSNTADNPGSAASTVAAGFDRGALARAAASAVAAPAERTVSVPVHDRHWSQAIAAQVLVLADHRIESATLRLTPEHLGPVDVRIDIQDSQVNVNFGAAHADTRNALEQALPRLREVFAGAGLTLGDASVQQQLRRGSQNRTDGARAAGETADAQPVAFHASLRAIGMIDEYA